MKKHKTTIIMVLFFFIGLIVLMYPTISNLYNQRIESKVIVNYDSIIKNETEESYVNYFNEALKYNQKLLNLNNPLITANTIKNYQDILNINGDGMIGYLTIDKIKLKLPIYHGSDSKVLSRAIGHLEGSSMPIGGLGTHSILSAHRGLPSFKLFTDIDKLEIGDTFIIHILNQQLTYEVDLITIVDPEDTSNLQIELDQDYVTLLTCTPYGINTQRLLVRGHRTANSKTNYITSDAYKISNIKVSISLSIGIIFILILVILFKSNKRRSL